MSRATDYAARTLHGSPPPPTSQPRHSNLYLSINLSIYLSTSTNLSNLSIVSLPLPSAMGLASGASSGALRRSSTSALKYSGL